MFAVSAVVVNPWPSVGAPPSHDVRVINPTAEPGPTRDADNPARQPFHARGIFSMSTGEPDQNATITVPLGKRLVIEHVSAFLGVPEGQKVLFSIGTRLAGMLEFHTLVAQEQGVFPQVLGLGPKATFAASQPARFYADPGTTVYMGVGRTSTTGTAAGSMVVSGHLVAVP